VWDQKKDNINAQHQNEKNAFSFAFTAILTLSWGHHGRREASHAPSRRSVHPGRNTRKKKTEKKESLK